MSIYVEVGFKFTPLPRSFCGPESSSHKLRSLPPIRACLQGNVSWKIISQVNSPVPQNKPSNPNALPLVVSDVPSRGVAREVCQRPNNQQHYRHMTRSGLGKRGTQQLR